MFFNSLRLLFSVLAASACKEDKQRLYHVVSFRFISFLLSCETKYSIDSEVELS